MARGNRIPFTWDEWKSWRDETTAMETELREKAIHAGVAFGQSAEDRGRRIARDLRAYREYVGKLAFNRIGDGQQLDLFIGQSEAWQ